MRTTRKSNKPGSKLGPRAKNANQAKLDSLIEQQGVSQSATFENMLGKGATWWETDADFDMFLRHLRKIRSEKG